MHSIKIQIPATSANLGPGFDTLGLALNLCNTIQVKRSDRYIMKLCGEGENNARVLKNNMFINIFEHHYTKLNGKMDTFEFIFKNKIPISRGLGSSSAVIVGAIYAAYAISNRKIPKSRLLNLALHYEKHPDNITPCVFGGFCVGTVIDDKVVYVKKRMPSHLRALLVVPAKPMSTNLSRQALPKEYKQEDAIFNIAHSSLLTAALWSEHWNLLAKASMDRIHQHQRMKTLPQLFSIRKKLISLKPLMNTLSGSGSTMFALFEEEQLKLVESKLTHLFPKPLQVIICRLNNEGVKITQHR